MSFDIGSFVGSLTGGFLGRDDRRQEADHAADRSDAMSREQMAFQERMSNSAYQRATTDMKAAGINPMVAYSQGGASTPNGASNSAPLANPTDIFGKAIATAMDAKRLDNETKQQGSQQALNDALSTKAIADAQSSGASAKESSARTAALESQLKAIAARAKADEVTSKFDYKAATYDAVANRVNRDTNSAKNVMSIFTGGKSLDPEKFFYGSKKTGEIYNP